MAASFLEIYNEGLEDLLFGADSGRAKPSAGAPKLMLIDDKKHGCVCNNLSEWEFEDAATVMQVGGWWWMGGWVDGWWWMVGGGRGGRHRWGDGWMGGGWVVDAVTVMQVGVASCTRRCRIFHSSGHVGAAR